MGKSGTTILCLVDLENNAEHNCYFEDVVQMRCALAAITKA